MKTIGQITVSIMIVILTVLTLFLGAHIILSIGKMYSLLFVTQFSFFQILGIFCIISLIKYKYKKVEKKYDKTFSESTLDAFVWLLEIVSSYLSIWLFAWLYYVLLK